MCSTHSSTVIYCELKYVFAQLGTRHKLVTAQFIIVKNLHCQIANVVYFYDSLEKEKDIDITVELQSPVHLNS